MSPTSYQAAPPRESMIADGRDAVKPLQRPRETGSNHTEQLLCAFRFSMGRLSDQPSVGGKATDGSFCTLSEPPASYPRAIDRIRRPIDQVLARFFARLGRE